MNCHNCGKSLSAEDRFCPSCGERNVELGASGGSLRPPLLDAGQVPPPPSPPLRPRQPIHQAGPTAPSPPSPAPDRAPPPRRRFQVSRRLAFGVVAIGLVASVGYLGFQALGDDPDQAVTDRADELAEAVGEEGTPPVTASPTPLTSDEIVRKLRDAVFRVDTFGCGYESGGTAFAVGEHLLITNWHVVVTDPTPTLVGRDDQKLRAEVLGWSEELDVAVLTVEESLTTQLRWARTEGLVEGQEITVMGYPVVGFDPFETDGTKPDVTFSVTGGRIVSFVVEDGVRVGLRTDGSVDSGNSGGPALTDRGEVAGLITAIDFGNTRSLGLATTRDGLGGILDDLVVAEGGMEADCTEGGLYLDPKETPFSPEYGVDHEDYGDHPVLDALVDRCRDADMTSCVMLTAAAAAGTEYAAIGETCGTGSSDESCTAQLFAAANEQARRDEHPRPGMCMVDGHGTDAYLTIDCDQLHEVEVMSSVQLSLGSGDRDLIDFEAYMACLEDFEPFVGRDYWSSDLEYGYLLPNGFSWDGDRTVYCLVTDPAQPVTGTLQGVER